MSEPPAPIPTDLASRIAHYQGNHYKFLLWLMANPSETQADGMRSLGLSLHTRDSWRRDIEGFAATCEAIKTYRGNLRTEAAKAIFQSATIPLAQAMVRRGTGDGRDAQRAGERILEEVGVLRKASDMIGETIDIMAIRIRSTLSSPAIESGASTVQPQLISGHTAGDDNPPSEVIEASRI